MNPELDWTEQGAPRSLRFGDVYFSAENGLAESRHVFLESTELARRWREEARPDFRIGELGFGTGLNFLACRALWRSLRSQRQTDQLHFISIEAWPLSREQLRRALAAWPELADGAEALLSVWPEQPGHVLQAHWPEDGLRLSLHFQAVDQALAALRTGKAAGMDTWFLDGFAPARNPQMWTADVFHALARLSRAGARFGTFTAAGRVRRGLEQAGFRVEKRAGFGRKREMLRGELMPPQPDHTAPWFRPAAPGRPERVLVVGAGLAGSATVYSLARRGVDCVLLDQHPHAAAEASGNLAGAWYPLLSQDLNPASRYSLRAVETLQTRLKELDSAGIAVEGQRCGVWLAARSEQAMTRYARIAEEPALAALGLRFSSDSTPYAGLALGPGLWIPGGGWLHPPGLCEGQLEWARHRGHLQRRFGATVVQLQALPNAWRVSLDDGETLDADAVVLCSGAVPAPWLNSRYLPLRPARGAVTLLPDAGSDLPRCVVCHKGYVTPAVRGWHSVGATVDNRERDTHVRPSDHARNLHALSENLPTLAAALSGSAPADCQGRASVRMTSPDRLPVIGPAPHWAGWLEDYADLRRGSPHSRYPPPQWQPGLYYNLGHGARGIAGSVLAGELLAAQLCGETPPLDETLIRAVHPGRFLIRALRRREL
ncbi:bifunctional tRNA (5-methylaminomethyl-2-thiouridine)(34)-methyltransferase MnmD/FAD-dependent 5-carboxymethylaminomethyl-2-thiouridine(34) oxidoreductase MnmC [Alkalilimnicola sp. S0819]|uniref:bifunctional tRNA (5-methylaminomethyl-2-thiouridine)(34)-methyltransferase MnmD/FAD-dependent 5-carboxymethylaminomethyl-2-thiouridine(34) oxidoreductase MnmC n=1 Tax=Alkalilimnicola sp. S0819 TaxID=2613922 RepID=UPI001261F26B|nr:bifunctional tRNA (5-methylaminomethyl-2-thiouridine)(34)-methyltransferase MnmD/FAD-dependent 5-carboxymethylaminomethyl-2-thiouridine(34) oxidoreductase MnmC [Alkalilimnicola sp. S0819]KAB7622792.1 bifunctional tRNA (5-methylaminomethyl-2-thiouridine)(34)-methyltransferase MnmD/FAD-dependent 5-carboxymethylaminomethyl-2-thiouridine(34) oxidoreductase MnmC [Alkalilimnicola sp. S0819]MPQ17288.1 bifunctional tRNA (5-methylaminomethyl-2-thiouridine)(34)-methyltransferase MnmD/FAD-dependent 5-car